MSKRACATRAGHDLVSFMGTTLSSPDGSSASYAQALRALDGDCNTCAFAQTLQGQPSTFDLSLVSNLWLNHGLD